MSTLAVVHKGSVERLRVNSGTEMKKQRRSSVPSGVKESNRMYMMNFVIEDVTSPLAAASACSSRRLESGRRNALSVHHWHSQ